MSLCNREASVVRLSVCRSVNFYTQVATSIIHMTRSPPNLHTMVPTGAYIQGVLKVKVKIKGHLIRTLFWLHENRFFYHKHDWIASKLTQHGPHTGLHPGCAQGQGQRQRSRDKGTSVMSQNVCHTVPSDVLSLHALSDGLVYVFQWHSCRCWGRHSTARLRLLIQCWRLRSLRPWLVIVPYWCGFIKKRSIFVTNYFCVSFMKWYWSVIIVDTSVFCCLCSDAVGIWKGIWSLLVQTPYEL